MIAKYALTCASILLAFPVLAKVEVPPDPKRPRVKLGGHAQIQTNQLQQVSASLPACTSPAFTEEEFRRVAPRGTLVQTVKPVRSGGRPVTVYSVKLAARNDKPARTVPLAQYVDEINAIEKFYNAHGVTLRQGKLAKLPPGKFGQAQRNTCVSRDALSGIRRAVPLIQYRLVDAPEGSGGGLLDERFEPPQTKPNPPGPGDVMGGVIKPGDLVMKPGDLTAIGKRFLRQDLAPIAHYGMGRGAPVTQVMKGCAKPCTFEIDNDAFVTPAAKALIERPDEVVHTVFGCKITTEEANNAEKCPALQKFVKKTITRRQQWAEWIDVNFFLANWKNVCAVIMHEEKQGAKGNSEMLYMTNGKSGGDMDMTTGQPAPTFFDGVLHFANSGIADCVLDVGSNSLFGVQFCLRYNSANDFSPAKGFNIHNDAGVQTDLSLFGFTFDLAGGKAHIDWVQPVSPKGNLALVQPVVGSTLQQGKETQHFEGPGGTFPVGPIPLTVRSFADIDLTVGAPVPDFTAPARWSGNSNPGRVGIGVGAGTDVSIGMEAAIDAFVLSAGVSGKLSLLSNTVKGDIKSLIAPASNELTVEKAYTFDATTLKGSISAFVEIDLIVYTERYTVELVSFPGKTTTWPLEKSTWGPAKAVIPSSATSGPVCN